MTSFLAILIFVWGTAMLAWWLVSRYLRQADLGKVRSRLLGAPAKKTKAAPKKIDLINRQDVKTGKFALQLQKSWNSRIAWRKCSSRLG